MRKSPAVPLTVLAAVAAFVTACQNEPRHCVDSQGRIVPDASCAASGSGGGAFRYVYGGSSGGRIGDTVVGGSTSPSGVSRGGFGGHGGEGGEGGGGGE
ncbi:hypothetical protein DYQ86_09025 [Acidobacteria bacterium AB60]|nr:hypothetical protein DYQ86_09025 [Acidobacteria bacterium AB60]